MSTDALTGWYGKLPSLGDFAQRRLPASFIETWDEWLASGLAGWREREGEAWLERYLAGPSWRFVLMPGVLGGDGTVWAGVLMPSVDKVGRYFPLTLAQPLPPPAGVAAQIETLLSWLQRLDDLAVDALQDDWSVEQLETELQRLGPWQAEAAAPTPLPEVPLALPTLELRPQMDVPSLLAGLAREQFLHTLQGRALWLHSDAQGQPLLRITTGLPGGTEFSDLLGRDCGDASPPSH